MPTIKSDLVNRHYKGGEFKEYEVSDETQIYDPNIPDMEAINARLASRGIPPMKTEVKDFEEKVQEARRQKLTGKERLSDSAKKRIEKLCDISKNIKDVTIDGNVYVLKTLKAKEMREALISAAEFDGTVNLPFETRRHLLARSLFQIADTDIELFLGDSSIEAKLEFLEELDELVLAELYDTYLKLVKEVKDRYTIKSNKDAEEVLSDLKK